MSEAMRESSEQDTRQENSNAVLGLFLIEEFSFKQNYRDKKINISSITKNRDLIRSNEANSLKERSIPLFFINEINDTSILELQEIRNRTDQFIANRIRERIEERGIRPAQTPAYAPSRYIFASSTGLRAQVDHYYPLRCTVDGREIEGVSHTRIDFTPGGRTSFDPFRMTESLEMGIDGIMEMIEAIEDGSFEATQTLVGTTNINMALIAQRLGFRIIDQCRTTDGKIDNRLTNFVVVARLDDVIAKVAEFKESGRIDRLQQRARKSKKVPVKA